LAGSNLTGIDFTPFAQQQDFMSTITGGNDSPLLSIPKNGLASTTLGGMDLGTLGGLGMDIAKAWMGYDASKKAYNLQKKALNANIDDLEMKQDVAYNNASSNVGVKKSLAGAFGTGTSAYDNELNRLKKYASDGGEETQNA